MKNTIVILLVTFFLFSCKKEEIKSAIKNNPNYKPYIISLEEKKLKNYCDSLNNSSNKIAIPTLSRGRSCESNLIIDRNNNLYYYQRNYIGAGCGVGMENDTIPYFLDLQLKDLIKIPKKDIDQFISENVLTKEERRQILVIASQKDTISDTVILKFLYTLKVPTYAIRRTNQEEDVVLHHKINNLYYDAEEIKWDSTKIKFRGSPFKK